MIFLPHDNKDEITDYCLSCRSSITIVGAMRVCIIPQIAGGRAALINPPELYTLVYFCMKCYSFRVNV